MVVFHVLSLQFVRRTFYSDFNLCYIRAIKFFSISIKFSVTAFFCKIEQHAVKTLFDGLFISTEKLVSDLLSGIIRDLRILSYKMVLFIYSVLI